MKRELDTRDIAYFEKFGVSASPVENSWQFIDLEYKGKVRI